ncbi:MAG: transglutaminase domain-containing protein [Panacibacter sp.]
MKLLITIFFLFAIKIAFAQGNSVPFQEQKINGTETADPKILAVLLTSTDSTDLQKVTSIFSWVTNNIAYNVRAFQYNNRNDYRNYLTEESEDSIAPLKPLNERVAEIVLKRKTAVCDGYARLFKILCDYAGIRSEIITGYARTNINRIGAQFVSNHKWNAVFIDSAWRLLDATWASGYINYRNDFQKEYNSHYFLAPPDEFMLDHYPEDLRWTLLPSTQLLKEFYNTPFKTTAFNKNYISAFKPAGGVIEANIGDSIVIELETNRSKKDLWVIDIPFIDSNTISVFKCCGVSKPVNTIKGNKISVVYTVVSYKAEWLNIIYEDEFIMRYKLNIIRPTAIQPNTVILK